jgi:hypothetical protein
MANLRRIALVLAGLWLLCAVIYIIMAPDRLPTYVLINNTRAKITVHADGTSLIIGPGESGEIHVFDARKLQPFFLETDGGRRNTYMWVPIGDRRRYIPGYRVYWQIEGDHKIYVLLPAPTGVVKELPTQPPGYPLEPR